MSPFARTLSCSNGFNAILSGKKNLTLFILTCLETIFDILHLFTFNGLIVTLSSRSQRKTVVEKGLNLFSWFLSCDTDTEPAFSCIYQFKIFGIQMSLPYCIPNLNQAGWQWILLCYCSIDKIWHYEGNIAVKTPQCSRTPLVYQDHRCSCSACIYALYICFYFVLSPSTHFKVCGLYLQTINWLLFLQTITMLYWLPVIFFTSAAKISCEILSKFWFS